MQVQNNRSRLHGTKKIERSNLVHRLHKKNNKEVATEYNDAKYSEPHFLESGSTGLNLFYIHMQLCDSIL